MTDITVECTGTDGVRLDRQRKGTGDTIYLAKGDHASIDEAFLTQVSAAEAGEPHLLLSNHSRDLEVDVYLVQDGMTTRRRRLAPERERSFELGEGERLLLVPACVLTKTRSKSP